VNDRLIDPAVAPLLPHPARSVHPGLTALVPSTERYAFLIADPNYCGSGRAGNGETCYQ
jgi:hypothetical protein